MRVPLKSTPAGHASVPHEAGDEDEVLRAPATDDEIRIMEVVARCDVEECDLQWIDLSSPETREFLCDCLRFKIGGLSAFTVLGLGGCNLGDSGAAAVLRTVMEVSRRSGSSLSKIDLFFNQLTGSGLGDVVNIFLEWGLGGPSFLGLAWNDIGDAGVLHLLPLLAPTSTCSITSISLASCLIGQAGGLLISDGLVDNNRIQSLSLKGNDIPSGTLTLVQTSMKPVVSLGRKSIMPGGKLGLAGPKAGSSDDEGDDDVQA